MIRVRVWCRNALALALPLLAALAVAAAEEPAPQLAWEAGPIEAKIGGSLAQIDVPEGYVFLGKEDTQKLLQLLENPVSGQEQAIVAPAGEDNWFMVFEWDPVGWVDDAEKAELDAAALLESVQQGTAAGNEERAKHGWAPLEIIGWQEEPHYDDRTKNLTWAILAQSEGHKIVNRNIKILGRRGVMTVTLVADPEQLAAVTPLTDQLLANYEFQKGNTYAEFVPGSDQIAKFGLGALVVGGGAAALAQTGLLARFWKAIAVGVAGLVASLKKLLGRKDSVA
jgi:uncharacterized membrane-anchored protein